MAKLTFGWGMFRQLFDWTDPDNVQIKADYLANAADAVITVTAGATAFAGGGQASATLITADYTNVTTVATAGDSVKLPTAAIGVTYTVTNSGANSLDLFPNTSDTIDAGAANTAIKIPAGVTVTFTAISAVNWKSGIVRLASLDGTAALPAQTFSTQPNMGAYKVSSTQLGFAVSGALVGGFNASGVFTGAVAEQVTDAGVAVDATLLKDGLVFAKTTPVAINATAVATAAQIVSGYITSTSAAAVAITTPTATAIAALIGAVRGTYFDFVIDNSVGANTVTLTLDASIAVVTPAITGGDTLTVSTANSVGVFRLVFISGTAAKIFRIG